MTRYYCSGFDYLNAFGHGLGDLFLKDLKDTKSIVFIPGDITNIKETHYYVEEFIERFNNEGIIFTNVNIINPNLSKHTAKKMINEASFIMLMGGDPFVQKELCKRLDIITDLKRFTGVILGVSAGAMLMSKCIIITPCSKDYPAFHIEEGLDLDGISIYPHNNTNNQKYPDILEMEQGVYKKEDLIKVAREYGEFYLLQDYYREDKLVDISVIRCVDGKKEYHIENEGKIWLAKEDDIILANPGITKKYYNLIKKEN